MMLFGAEGAARVALVALVKEGVSDIMLIVRTLEHGSTMLKDLLAGHRDNQVEGDVYPIAALDAGIRRPDV